MGTDREPFEPFRNEPQTGGTPTPEGGQLDRRRDPVVDAIERTNRRTLIVIAGIAVVTLLLK